MLNSAPDLCIHLSPWPVFTSSVVAIAVIFCTQWGLILHCSSSGLLMHWPVMVPVCVAYDHRDDPFPFFLLYIFSSSRTSEVYFLLLLCFFSSTRLSHGHFISMINTASPRVQTMSGLLCVVSVWLATTCPGAARRHLEMSLLASVSIASMACCTGWPSRTWHRLHRRWLERPGHGGVYEI